VHWRNLFVFLKSQNNATKVQVIVHKERIFVYDRLHHEGQGDTDSLAAIREPVLEQDQVMNLIGGLRSNTMQLLLLLT
jgi:hypothetical protein